MNKKLNYYSKKTKESIVNYFKKIIAILKQPEMAVLPGQLAFVMILSVVPIVTLICYVVSLFNINSQTVIEYINTAFPSQVDFLSPIFDGSTMDLTLIFFLITSDHF